MVPAHLGDTRARRKRLRQDPEPVFVAPPPTPLRPRKCWDEGLSPSPHSSFTQHGRSSGLQPPAGLRWDYQAAFNNCFSEIAARYWVISASAFSSNSSKLRRLSFWSGQRRIIPKSIRWRT